MFRHVFRSPEENPILVPTMAPGMYIVAVCAVGGVIASAAFWWAIRTGQFSHSDEGKYLVFDDEDDVPRPPVRLRDPGRK